jgi:hypothetical protein
MKGAYCMSCLGLFRENNTKKEEGNQGKQRGRRRNCKRCS